MSRLFLFEGEDHPYAENIYAQLEAPASMPKKLDEYTKQEFENYPKLFWSVENCSLIVYICGLYVKYMEIYKFKSVIYNLEVMFFGIVCCIFVKT